MKKSIATLCLAATTFAVPSGFAAEHYRTYNNGYSRSHYVQHKRHMKTMKRVGIGGAGGAVVGGLLGGGKGAAIGALAGGGTGYLYDRHEKHQGKY